LELTERSEIALPISASCAYPSNGTRNDKRFEGIVREATILPKGRLVEDVFVRHAWMRL